MSCSPQQLAPVNGIVALTGSVYDGLAPSEDSITTLLTGDATWGTYVRSITIKSINPPNAEGMIRLWISTTGDWEDYGLINEIWVPAATNGASGSTGTTSPTFGTTVYFNSLFLGPNVLLGVTTQSDDSFVISAMGEYIIGFVS